VRSDWQTSLGNTFTDRARAESSIQDCYRYAGLNPPSIVWIEHPLNIVKISIDRPDLYDISDVFISELWQSELEIQKHIDPDSVRQVITTIDPQHPLDISIGNRQLDPIADRLNDRVMSQANNIYTDLTGKTIPTPFQNYQTGYLSYFDYFLQIGINITHLQPAIDLAKSCGWCWTFEKLTILTPKPSKIQVDRLGNIIGIIYDDVNILRDLG
jgi:hypothetical protein